MTGPVNPEPPRAGPPPAPIAAPAPASHPADTIAGLAIGGLSLGTSQVLKGARRLEKAVAEMPAAPSEGGAPATQTELVRQGLVGLAFASTRRAMKGVQSLEAGVRDLGQRVPVSRLPGTDRAGRSLEMRIARAEARGRKELARYAVVGRAEEEQAAQLGGSALHAVADTAVDQVATITVTRVAESDVVHELFISQSSTMAEEMIDIIRERADTFDERLERLARRVFRRGRPRPAGSVQWLQGVLTAEPSQAPEGKH